MNRKKRKPVWSRFSVVQATRANQKGVQKMNTVNYGDKYVHRVTLRLSDDQYHWLIGISKILGVTPSEYMRMSINTGCTTDLYRDYQGKGRWERMRTSKPVSTISYRNLSGRLERLKIAYPTICSSTISLKAMKRKNHIHLWIKPNKLIDTWHCKPTFLELDAKHPTKPLKCIDFRGIENR